jgi:hypothetical protein
MLRERARLTLDDAAPKLRWSTSKLSRIEHGQLVDYHALKSMLDLYGVTADRWPEYFELHEAAGQNGWWKAYGLDDKGYVPLEADASEVREFIVTSVPGLLQTADYARAIFRAAVTRRSVEELRNEVAVRMIRQKRLSSAENPLRLVAIMDVAVLHRVVGGPKVMAAQLARLIESAASDAVTLQVLPAGIGAHTAMTGGFSILSFGELGEPDIVYVEHSLGSTMSETESDVARTTLRFDRLRSDALSPDDSLALIRRAAERYNSPP